MKKLAIFSAPLILVLSACTTTGTATNGTTSANLASNSLAMMAVNVAVQAKCINELESNSYWRSASRLVGDQAKQQLQTEVCGCVGEKATTSVTITDLMVAAMDKTSQATLASKVVANTLNACVVEAFKN